MTFWNHIEHATELRHVLSGENDDDNLPFFALDVLLYLFPNLMQIEYCNLSCNSILDIVEYVMKYRNNKNIENNLKHIIIYHEASLPNTLRFEDTIWNLYNDEHRIILTKSNDIADIDFVYDKIALGSTSKHLLTNLAMK